MLSVKHSILREVAGFGKVHCYKFKEIFYAEGSDFETIHIPYIVRIHIMFSFSFLDILSNILQIFICIIVINIQNIYSTESLFASLSAVCLAAWCSTLSSLIISIHSVSMCVHTHTHTY